MIHYILLAAGLSKRFGGGENKLFYQVEGVPMYRRALLCAMEIKKRWETDIILVASHPEILRQTSGLEGVRTVVNRDPGAGISRSIALGIRAAWEMYGGERPDDWLLFSVCDQPWLTAKEVSRLIEKAVSEAGKEKEAKHTETDRQKDKKALTGKGILALSHGGEAKNPVMFRAGYSEELLALCGDRGGKVILRRHRDDVLLVEAEREKALEDLDVRPEGENGQEGMEN